MTRKEARDNGWLFHVEFTGRECLHVLPCINGGEGAIPVICPYGRDITAEDHEAAVEAFRLHFPYADRLTVEARREISDSVLDVAYVDRGRMQR